MQELPRDGIVIPRSSRETFVPLQHPNCAVLRDAGILLAGISTLTKGYRVYRKAPDFHLVLSTISGEAEVRYGDSSSRLKAGDAFVAPVGNPYGYAPVAYPWVILWFHLSGVSTRRGLDGSPVRILHDAGTLSPVEPFMRGLALETLRQHGGGARICSLYSELILEHLDRFLGRTAAGRIAEMRHLFAAVWDRAREMVWYTDRPIALIAEQVGYGDPFAFSTAFKKRFGKSPAGYRNGPA